MPVASSKSRPHAIDERRTPILVATACRQALSYMPELDGVRAFCVLAVFAYHSAPGIFPAGFLGVDLFFVLSGFLITRLLEDEWQRTSGVRLGNFYLRRCLRLYPALIFYAVSCVLASAFSAKPDAFAHSLTGAFYSLTYLSNWSTALFKIPLGLLSHTWSLSIEEQFYLLWAPSLLLLMKRVKGARWWPVLFLGLLSWGLRAWLFSQGVDSNRMYSGLDTRLDSILFGCAAALWLSENPNVGENRKNLRWIAAGILAAWCLTVGLLQGVWADGTFQLYAFGLTALASAVAFTALAATSGTRDWLSWVLTHPFLVATGRISYGMYLWHPFAQDITPRLIPDLKLRLYFPLSLALTYALAYFSNRVVERPFLRLKEKLSNA